MEDKRFILPEKYYQKLIAHGFRQLPLEACGLLAGNENKVQSIWHLENELNSRKRFFVKKSEVETVLQKISNRNEKVLAIYHSHPSTAPVPSYYDLVNHPDSATKMVIVSYKKRIPLVKCYHIQGLRYQECPLLIEKTKKA